MAIISLAILSCWDLITWVPEPRSFLFYSAVEHKHFSFIMEKDNSFNDTLETTY